MGRFWLVIASAAVVLAVGCGQKSYVSRLENTLAKLEYDRRIRKNLMDPPKDDKKFTDLAIYVRAPKEEKLAKAGQLPVAEGQFDLDASFNDEKEASSALHVLARVKMPKKTPAKGAPPVAAPPPRGEFVGEVIGVLSIAFNAPEALQAPKLADKASEKYGNRFRRLIFTAGEKEVALYTYKQGAHEVALVFVYDLKQKNPLTTKIELCLDSFAVAEKAKRLYSGGVAEEEETGPAAPM